jgi:hypothetical protein
MSLHGVAGVVSPGFMEVFIFGDVRHRSHQPVTNVLTALAAEREIGMAHQEYGGA